ncbi:hypothetical protein [Streptomyces spectabilis]|uniref:Uncharacterized protein n=1 Tax=Streptomyces spectabilis TaxID=68270 RepID=A0A516RG51_STRST|nr:hypothetical protein [Streptomyces spectabilis]QDQ14637.1 hypothetical protein FH965_32195 [Streptomyces spectabilis]
MSSREDATYELASRVQIRLSAALEAEGIELRSLRVDTAGVVPLIDLGMVNIATAERLAKALEGRRVPA